MNDKITSEDINENGIEDTDLSAQLAQLWAASEFGQRTAEQAARLRPSAFDALDALGVEAVSLSFDGSGDEGALSIDCDDSHGQTLDEATREAVLDYAYSLLEKWCPGWEINEGSSGTIRLAVQEQKAEITLSRRYEEVATERLPLPLEFIDALRSAGLATIFVDFDGEQGGIFCSEEVDEAASEELLRLATKLAKRHSSYKPGRLWQMRADTSVELAAISVQLGEREAPPTTFVD